MIALDTNILVHAHRPEMPFHARAKSTLSDLVASGRRYGIPMHCLVEFSGVVRHRKIFKAPSSVAQVRAQVEAWLEPVSAWLLPEEEQMLPTFFELVAQAKAEGGAVHDARIAACCLALGVSELWTADRDFSRYAPLKTRNPLIGCADVDV